MSKGSAAALMTLFFSTTDLVRKISLNEAEGLFGVTAKSSGEETVPFGALRPEWKKLVQKMQGGDELWEFSHPAPNGIVFRGVKLLRDSKVVDAIVGSASTPGG
jgi:hypothetical protein